MLWAREEDMGEEMRDKLRLKERSKQRSEQKAGRAGVAGAGSGWRPAGARFTSLTRLHVMDPLNKVPFFLPIKLSSILEPQHLAVQVELHVYADKEETHDCCLFGRSRCSTSFHI
jgi:hypothetical protein